MIVISSDFQELLGLAHRIVVISDGRSVADMPSSLLNEETLTLLAAPRSSMQCNTALLEALVQDYGGAGFWLLIEADRLICLNLVLANPSATPGFKRGEGMAFPQSAIPAGLAQRGNGFISEADGSRVTAMLPCAIAAITIWAGSVSHWPPTPIAPACKTSKNAWSDSYE